MTQSNKSIAYYSPCDQVQLDLIDGYQSQGRFFDSPSCRRAVLYLHGIQSHSGWFLRSAKHLHQQGISLLMPDRRGSGLNSTNRGYCSSANQLIDDVNTCADWLIEKTAVEKIDILAVSWGAKLALTYAGRHPERVRSITLVGPGLCPHSHIDITLKEKISVGVSGVINRHKLYPIPLTEPSLFTANEVMKQFIAADPLMLHEATASFFIASTQLDFLLRRSIAKLTAPVHLFLAESDRIIDNAATIDLLRPALVTPPNSTTPAIIYPQAEHTLEFEPDPTSFLTDLAAAITQ